MVIFTGLIQSTQTKDIYEKSAKIAHPVPVTKKV
jgi:hypothetical protein